MRNINKAGILMVAAIASASIGAASAAGAQEDDLNCGDPGTYHNMPVPPGDPDGLDSDDDGIGCEDPSVFDQPPATEPPPPPPPAPPTTAAPAPAPLPAPAPPAVPVAGEPDFTG
jgi:hypothetical protein